MTKFTTYFFFFKSYLTYFAYLDIFGHISYLDYSLTPPPPPPLVLATACAVNSLQSNLHMRKTLVVETFRINQSINNRVFLSVFYAKLSLILPIFITKSAKSKNAF